MRKSDSAWPGARESFVKGRSDVLVQQVLIDLWQKDRKTALMVTHDVDEAILLADRVVMMTSGPNAKVGEIVMVPFSRPRDRERSCGLRPAGHIRPSLFAMSFCLAAVWIAARDRKSADLSGIQGPSGAPH